VRFRALNAIVELRKTAAEVVVFADAAIYGNDTVIAEAMRRLPSRVRLLELRAQRALTALEEGGEPETKP
jgi:hypothetical protein